MLVQNHVGDQVGLAELAGPVEVHTRTRLGDPEARAVLGDEALERLDAQGPHPVVVDDHPQVGIVCRQGESRGNPGPAAVRALGELEVVVAGLDRVPVELGLDLGAVGCDEIVATAFPLAFDVGPVHRFGECALVARLVIDEIADAGHAK